MQILSQTNRRHDNHCRSTARWFGERAYTQIQPFPPHLVFHPSVLAYIPTVNLSTRERKKKLTKALPEFCSRFLEFSAGLPLTCIEDSAQDYNVQSTGRGQYCTVFDRTFFIYNNENHAGICSLRNPTKCQKK